MQHMHTVTVVCLRAGPFFSSNVSKILLRFLFKFFFRIAYVESQYTVTKSGAERIADLNSNRSP
jgi:hypothetical protein